MDFPQIYTFPEMNVISAANLSSGPGQQVTAQGRWSALTGVWPTASLALFWPVYVETAFKVIQFGWENGATVSASTSFDVGVYDEGYNRIFSKGNTAQSGVSAPQFVSSSSGSGTVSPTLGPGVYFMAMSVNGTTTGLIRNTNLAARALRAMGVQQMAAANPLPAVLVPAAMTQAYLPFLSMIGSSVA